MPWKFQKYLELVRTAMYEDGVKYKNIKSCQARECYPEGIPGQRWNLLKEGLLGPGAKE